MLVSGRRQLHYPEDEELRKRIDALKATALVGPKLSTLRLLDIAIWMSGGDPPGTVTGDED